MGERQKGGREIGGGGGGIGGVEGGGREHKINTILTNSRFSRSKNEGSEKGVIWKTSRVWREKLARQTLNSDSEKFKMRGRNKIMEKRENTLDVSQRFIDINSIVDKERRHA